MERMTKRLGNLRNLLGVDFEGEKKGPGIISSKGRKSLEDGPGVMDFDLGPGVMDFDLGPGIIS